MTVAGAMFCDGYLLIAADSEASEPDFKFSVPKIQNLTNLPMAWTFSGNASLGQEFSAWFREYMSGVSSIDWNALIKEARRKVAEINGELRRMKRLARVKIEEEDTSKFLLAGYLNGDPRIIKLDDQGEVN